MTEPSTIEIAERARALVGSRFRLHGRDAETGLDCVGVAARATGLAVPTGYALRGGSADGWAAVLDAALVRATTPAPGAIALAHAGPGQFHLIVLTGDGFVHADAALRRVVERPGPPPWPVIGYWRR